MLSVLPAASLAAAAPALGQPGAGHPGKPIRLVSGFPPGAMSDFAGVGQIGPITQGGIVSPSSGFKSPKERVARAAAQPGKIMMGSSRRV
jgi:tripartite-type tricarboxylate transporter receptor subunit TctC